MKKTSYTVSDLARELDLSPQRVRVQIEMFDIPYQKLTDKMWLLKPAARRALLRARKKHVRPYKKPVDGSPSSDTGSAVVP